MQPITVDFTSIIFDVVTSGNGMVALFFLFFLLAKIVDLVSEKGLHGEIDFQLDKAYDSYISYLDEKKYSKETLEPYDPLDDLHGYEDRLSDYRQRKKDGLDGISASTFSFSEGGNSGDHLMPYAPNSKDPYIDFSLYPDTSSNDSYIDDNGMDVYLTWDEIENNSNDDALDSPINNDDYIPLLDVSEDEDYLSSDDFISIIGSDLTISNFDKKEDLFSDSYSHTDDYYSDDNGMW